MMPFVRQDPGESSDRASDDSGFEDMEDTTGHKKVQRLENDKYDLALEV